MHIPISGIKFLNELMLINLIYLKINNNKRMTYGFKN